jgi:ACS family allantoate permease-like MFS transporter
MVVVNFMGRMLEALTDPKTWLFALFTTFTSIPNSLINQLQIITVSFGFNPIQTTLLSCVNGVVIFVAILTCVTIASRAPNSIAWVGMAFYVLDILGVFMVNFLPWRDKVGLLFGVWIAGTLLVPRRADSANPRNQVLRPPALC